MTHVIYERLAWLLTPLRFLPPGDGVPKENSPFINNTENDKNNYDGTNMALFEVFLASFLISITCLEVRHWSGCSLKSLCVSKHQNVTDY